MSSRREGHHGHQQGQPRCHDPLRHHDAQASWVWFLEPFHLSTHTHSIALPSLDHIANNIASATFEVINSTKVRTADMGGTCLCLAWLIVNDDDNDALLLCSLAHSLRLSRRFRFCYDFRLHLCRHQEPCLKVDIYIGYLCSLSCSPTLRYNRGVFRLDRTCNLYRGFFDFICSRQDLDLDAYSFPLSVVSECLLIFAGSSFNASRELTLKLKPPMWLDSRNFPIGRQRPGCCSTLGLYASCCRPIMFFSQSLTWP